MTYTTADVVDYVVSLVRMTIHTQYNMLLLSGGYVELHIGKVSDKPCKQLSYIIQLDCNSVTQH